MLSKILSFFENQAINIGKTNILVAVSGGVDSVVLCYIFSELGIKFGMAHCNFKLRGEASHNDAAFVEELAAYLNVPFHKKEFETKKLLDNSKESTQSLARKLRYEWFDELLNEKKYDLLATAHHFNDVVETMLFNQARGTGIRGMRGILPKNGTTIRPLLACTKAEILALATENEIHYAEDESNSTDDYQRNFIRRQIIPKFEKINPSFLIAQSNNRKHLLDLENLLNERVAQVKSDFCKTEHNLYIIDYSKIKSLVGADTIIFELLHSYEFNQDQVEQIQSTFPANGKIFRSNSHELLIHQQQLLVRSLNISSLTPIKIQEKDTSIQIGNKTLLLETQNGQLESIQNDPNIAYFDMDQLKFPLTIRTWKAGDVFQPFGMNGKKKKVQDFFSDQKVSLFEKEQIPLLVSGQQIIWIVGMRTDETAKITSKTKKILKISTIQASQKY